MNAKLCTLIAGMILATVGTGFGQTDITITSQPANQTNCVGTTMTLGVEATGTDPLAYQWQHAYDLYNFLDLPKGTNASLIIENVSSLDAGNFRVIITNAFASVTSAVARLYVASPPAIGSSGQPTNWLVVSLGASVTNRVMASGPPTSYQWRLNGLDLLGQTKSTIILTNLQLADEGDYDVIVVNSCGSTNSQVVTLKLDPTFVKVTKPDVVQGSGDMWMPYWVDLEGDGWLELVVAGGWGTGGGKPLMVYQNNHDGTLSRILTNDLSKIIGRIAAIAWADLDDDGDIDAFAGQWEGQTPLYLRNEGGGRFTKITANRNWTANGIATVGSTPSCADFDNDGFLDLVVGYWGNNAVGVWGTNTVLRGLGAGRFEVDLNSPLALSQTWTEFFSWADWNQDGLLDLFGATSGDYSQVDLMFQNLGGGHFLRITDSPVVKVRDVSINAPWGDYDNDGDLDLFVTSWNTTNQLYRNQGNGVFEVDPASPRFPSGQQREVAAWGDYDNDGWLDLFIVHYNRTSRLFHNRGDGTLEEIATGSPVTECRGYGGAWGDYDNDGFLDLCAVYGDGAVNYLYRNNLRSTGNTNGWLKVRLIGAASNRSGIGAAIRIKATMGGRELWQMRQIACQGAEAALLAHFGLGDATNVDMVRIEWPSGEVQELTGVARDQILTVTEQTYITPVRPTASLGGSVTVTASRTGAWQWFHDGVAMEGQTNRTLALSNLQIADGGRYSVVTGSAGTFYTNFVYVYVDTHFTKINEGPVVTDTGNCPAIASGDYDGDGYADLFVTRYQLGTSAVYRNKQDGTFARVLDLPFGKQSNEIGVWGDLNNDGSVDLLHELIGSAGGACLSASVYFNNADGTFTVTQRAPTLSYGNRSLVDYNNDGFLDVYYSRFAQNRLYRNNGDQTFTLMTASEVGPVANVTTFGGTCWADFNDDGWPDVYAPHYQGSQSLMFRNDGTGRFVAVNNLVTRTTAPAIAGDWGDYDNDGRLDLCVAALNGTSVVYRNLGNGEFERPAGTPSLTGPCNFVTWVDYDNDGFLDLFFSGYTSGNKLFRNNGDGTFTHTTTGSIVNEGAPLGAGSYAGLWFDYDNDGFLDLYVINGDDASSIPTANQLYHNNGNSNAWLRVKLVGTVSNRDGIGAKVRVQAIYAGSVRWQRRDIIGGDEDNGNHLTADFGLGNATVVNKLRIEWPSGVAEEFANVAPRQILTIVEPSLRGSLEPDGLFHVSMTMSTNRVYQLQRSPDMVTWSVLTNCTGSGSSEPIEYMDPEAPTAGATRFYRMK